MNVNQDWLQELKEEMRKTKLRINLLQSRLLTKDQLLALKVQHPEQMVVAINGTKQLIGTVSDWDTRMGLTAWAVLNDEVEAILAQIK